VARLPILQQLPDARDDRETLAQGILCLLAHELQGSLEGASRSGLDHGSAGATAAIFQGNPSRASLLYRAHRLGRGPEIKFDAMLKITARLCTGTGCTLLPKAINLEVTSFASLSSESSKTMQTFRNLAALTSFASPIMFRRSECPRMTHGMPRSASCSALRNNPRRDAQIGRERATSVGCARTNFCGT
jgi:hypothetical protein